MALPEPIGSVVDQEAARLAILAGFQVLLRGCASAGCRKALVMAAYDSGAISPEECEALIQTLMLETA